MIRILIADDHEIVRRGLRQIIEEQSDMAVVGEAGTGQQVLDKVDSMAIDVLLLDISMPGLSGIEVLKIIKSTPSSPAVLILTMHPEEQYAVRVLKAGASGYLTKESASEELINAIRKVSAGGKYITSQLAEVLASRLQMDESRQSHESLSDREFQVLIQIASGKTVSQIAVYLSLSVKTISTYRHRILEKMQLKNNMEIMQYAMHNHLIDS